MAAVVGSHWNRLLFRRGGTEPFYQLRSIASVVDSLWNGDRYCGCPCWCDGCWNYSLQWELTVCRLSSETAPMMPYAEAGCWGMELVPHVAHFAVFMTGITILYVLLRQKEDGIDIQEIDGAV